MYIDPRDLARRQRQFSLAPQWPGISPGVGTDMTTGPTASEPAEQLDLDRYPTWAHSLMAQVFPNLDGTGRLSTIDSAGA